MPNLLNPFFGMRPIQNKKNLICFSNCFYDNILKQEYCKENFFKEQTPSFYVCEVREIHKRSVGIIAAMPLSFFNKKILRHEKIINEKASYYTSILKKTGIQLNPVVLFHENVHVINEFMDNWTQKTYDLQINLKNSSYNIWIIHEKNIIATICEMYSNLNFLFIGDGHHRLEGLATLANQEMFMAFLLSENQIFLHDICRVYPNLTSVENLQIKNTIKKYFTLTENKSSSLHNTKNIHFFANENKYYLHPVENDLIFNASHYLFEILNKIQIASSSFSFNNFPCTTLNEFYKKNTIKDNNFAKFFIPSINFEYLYDVIKKGEILPPHSTWFEPKLPTGLISFPLYN